jgi:hypothetical protein
MRLFSTFNLKNRPKVLDELLDKEGDQVITNIRICREPIRGIFTKILNFATFGRMKAEMERLGYDNLYHLHMIVYLQNGKMYTLEKNERVTIFNKELRVDTCTSMIPYGKKTFRQFMVDSETQSDDNFYKYSSFRDNCQKWILDIMQANGINNFDNFIKQDVKELAPSWVKKVANFFTDAAGYIDIYKTGGGLGRMPLNMTMPLLN